MLLTITTCGQNQTPGLIKTLTTFLVLAIALFASAPSDAKKKKALQVIVTTTYLNMHTGPGRGYPIFYVVEKGETITLLKSRTDWIKVATRKGQEGWIHRRYMEETIGTEGELVDLGVPDRDDFSQRRWELGVGIGDFEETPSLGIHGGFRFSNNLTAEMRLTQATGRFSNSQVVTYGLLHHPFPKWRFAPFFALARGQITTNANSTLVQTPGRTSDLQLVGVGAYYYISHRFMIRAEYNQYTILPSRDENIEVNEWKLGLSAFF